MNSDLETDKEFDAFCAFHASIGWIALLTASHAARRPSAGESVGHVLTHGELAFQLGTTLAFVMGFALFFGFGGLWIALTGSNPERKERFIYWHEDTDA